MYIHQAAKAALETGQAFYRVVDSDGKKIYILPTNTPMCCIVSMNGVKKPAPRWEPTAEDLTRDDWMVGSAEDN
jgi:hypothetical protein